MEKRKVVVGIFAHPDDETFGPGGTLAMLAKDNDVYIICATSGESVGGNIDKKLGEERRKELEASSKILGIKQVFFLGFIDGTLSNNLYHVIAKKVESILEELQSDTLITFEPRGVSGHIDHITMSMVTQFLFPQIPSAKKLMMYALPYERTLLMQGKYFIHFPKGYKAEEFGKVINVSDVWEIKVRAMRQHKTQLKDVERILFQSEKLPKEEHFLIEEK